jgi:predicted glycoside hydrolase/deacetylase ChbG (UPF0249 family)
MTARLIINADDFGLTEGINRAIIELHHIGAVTSTSLIATAPSFHQAAAFARATPSLGLGCHLTFVDGFPAAHPESIPTLLGADGKTFRSSFIDFAQAAIRGSIDADDIAREAQAQIQLIQRTGLDVTHVDTHKHTHIFPSILQPVLYVAQRCGIDAIRNPFEPKWSIEIAQASLSRRLQIGGLQLYQSKFSRMTQPSATLGFVPSGTIGIAATGSLNAQTLRATLAALPPEGTFELCCHPGYVDQSLASVRTRLQGSRAVEFYALSEVIPEYLRTSTASELIHYGNLGIPGLQRASGQFEPFTGHEKVL